MVPRYGPSTKATFVLYDLQLQLYIYFIGTYRFIRHYFRINFDSNIMKRQECICLIEQHYLYHSETAYPGPELDRKKNIDSICFGLVALPYKYVDCNRTLTFCCSAVCSLRDNQL